jgi:hypothetical protein
MSPLRLSLTAAVLISAVIPLSAAQRLAFADDAMTRSVMVQFRLAIDDYLSRGRAVGEDDPETLCLPEDSYRWRALPLADDRMFGEGHIFFPEVARIFRQRIAGALRWQERRREHVLAMLNREESAAPPLAVGHRAPAAASDMMIGWLIEILPALPPELAYRRVGRDLVLVDLRANLVIDVLRGAVPLY